MKIQISFDTFNITEIIAYAHQFENYCDQISIGTLPLYKEGAVSIQQIKTHFPKKLMIANIRLTNYVHEHAKLFASLGVHAISVLPGISRTMLHAATTAAHENGMKIILELFDTTFMSQSILEAKQLGVDSILFHYLHDTTQQQFLSEQWDFVKDNINLPILLETSLTKEMIDSLLVLRPEVLVINEQFMKSKNAIDDIKYIHQLFNIHR